MYRAQPPQPGVFTGKFGQPLWIRVPWKYVGYDFGKYPLVNIQKTMEITIFYRKTHYKLPFSIAMLNDQRVPSPVYGSIGNKCENMLKYDEHMVKTWRNHGERNVEQR